MADTILKLKVNSSEYDNKLKQATNGLTRYVSECRKVGGTLEQVEKETLDYVKSVGQMEAVSKTATGKLSEMSKTFVELSAQYKNLTDLERQSPFGKALGESLDQLKVRINSSKAQLDEIKRSISDNTGGGIFDGLGSKMEGALAVFGGNLMTKAAGMTAGFVSELGDAVKQGVELAKQGEGIRIAFERLGRGDILDGLRQATHGTVTDLELMKAAVKFNDFKLPVEELGTMLAFAQQKAKDTGQSVDYMVDSIVTGLGRKSLMILDNLGLSASEIKEKMKETGDMTKAVGEIIREQMAKSGDYVETAAARAAQANVSLQNKMEELGRKFAPVEEASNQLWTSMKIGILDIIGGPLATLINQLTEAGRLKNTLNNINGGSDGNPTRVQKYLQNLNNSNNKQSLYDRQLEKINRVIMGLDAQSKQKQRLISNSENEEYANAQKVLKERIDRQMQAWMMIRDEYKKGAKDILTPPKAENPTKGLTDMPTASGPRNSTTPNLTPSQQAEADVQKALKEYADAIANAQEKVMANMITGDDYNKQVQQWQQRLADAYLKAYNVTGNDQYLEGFKESAERYNEMSDVIKENIDSQKQQQQAARELEQAQKKLAEAQKKLADAQASGSATAIYKAQTAVDKLKSPNAQAQPTGFAALMQSIQGELKFDQMNVDETTLRTLLSTAIKNGIDEVTVDYNLLQDKISKGIDIPDSTWMELQNEINAKLAKLGIEPIKIDFNTGGLSTEGKKAEKSWQGAAVAVSAVGSAMSQIEDPAAKVMGTIAQAIATVALSFAQAMLKPKDPWSWIAFAAAGTATMISTISAIHSATGYANGGIVGGNSFSGDNVYGGPDAMVNSGELILNKAQQNVVAQELQGGSRMIQVHGVLRGKDIFIAAENWSKSVGKGELVTW